MAVCLERDDNSRYIEVGRVGGVGVCGRGRGLREFWLEGTES